MMNFFKRIGIYIYMLMMVGVGALLVLISLGMVSAEQYANIIQIVNSDDSYKAAGSAIGAIFMLVGVIAPRRMGKNLKKNRVVAFQNPDGEVTVSLSAVEDYIRKVARNVTGIKDINPSVDISKKGINIVTDISISADANIPEITEKIQMEVRNKVHAMLGVEEPINMKMHVTKILKGVKQEEEIVEQEGPGEPQVPFR